MTFPECHESVPQFCHDRFEFWKGYAPFCLGCAPGPLVEDSEEGSLFVFLKPDGLVHAIKVKAQQAFGCVECAVPLAQLFCKDGVIGVILT